MLIYNENHLLLLKIFTVFNKIVIPFTNIDFERNLQLTIEETFYDNLKLNKEMDFKIFIKNDSTNNKINELNLKLFNLASFLENLNCRIDVNVKALDNDFSSFTFNEFQLDKIGSDKFFFTNLLKKNLIYEVADNSLPNKLEYFFKKHEIVLVGSSIENNNVENLDTPTVLEINSVLKELYCLLHGEISKNIIVKENIKNSIFFKNFNFLHKDIINQGYIVNYNKIPKF